MMTSTVLTALAAGPAKPTSASALPADDANVQVDFASMLLGLAGSDSTVETEATVPLDDIALTEAAPAADAPAFDPTLAADTLALDPALLLQLATPLAKQPVPQATDVATPGAADAPAIDPRVDPELPVDRPADPRVLIDAAATAPRSALTTPRDAGSPAPARVPDTAMPADVAAPTLDQASPDAAATPAIPSAEPAVRLAADNARGADKASNVSRVDDRRLEAAPSTLSNAAAAMPAPAAHVQARHSDAHAPEVRAVEATPSAPLSAATGHSAATPSPIAASPPAVATPPSHAIATPFDSPAFAAALGARVSVLARDGVQRAELQLNPAEMGPIAVRIDLDGVHATVHFSADTAATRSVLESSWPELATALRDSGLTLTGGGVSEQAAQRGRRDAAPDAARHKQPGDDPAPAGGDASAPRARRTRGVVDLIA